MTNPVNSVHVEVYEKPGMRAWDRTPCHHDDSGHRLTQLKVIPSHPAHHETK